MKRVWEAYLYKENTWYYKITKSITYIHVWLLSFIWKTKILFSIVFYIILVPTEYPISSASVQISNRPTNRAEPMRVNLYINVYVYMYICTCVHTNFSNKTKNLLNSLSLRECNTRDKMDRNISLSLVFLSSSLT